MDVHKPAAKNKDTETTINNTEVESGSKTETVAEPKKEEAAAK
jgi:hypothetical protein